jgi:hypothetical protein
MPDQGRKMINLSLSLWTDKMPGAPEGDVLPKHCWSYGTLRLKSNGRHGIKGSKARPWNKVEEIGPLLIKLLEEGGITVHEVKRGRRKSTPPTD